MGSFATGCTIMTLTHDSPHGMTANAFSSVSMDPPLCLVCLDHGTTTYELIVENGVDSFAVNILTDQQESLAEHFAGMEELEEDPFDDRETRIGDTGSPIFMNSLAYLDCKVYDLVPAGDHTICLGQIEDLRVIDPDADALTFFRGKWGNLSADAGG